MIWTVYYRVTHKLGLKYRTVSINGVQENVKKCVPSPVQSFHLLVNSCPSETLISNRCSVNNLLLKNCMSEAMGEAKVHFQGILILL